MNHPGATWAWAAFPVLPEGWLGSGRLAEDSARGRATVMTTNFRHPATVLLLAALVAGVIQHAGVVGG